MPSITDSRLLAPSCPALGPAAMVHENSWFTVMDRGGYFTMESPPQVIILPVVDNRAVVMVRVRRPVVADCPLELPAGGFADGEAPHQAAARELAEETGIRIDDPQRFLPQPPVAGSPDRNPLLLHIFRVDLTPDDFLTRGPHDQEIQAVELLDYPRVARLLHQGEIYVAAPMAVLGRHLLGLDASSV